MTRHAVFDHERLLRIACGIAIVALLVAKIPLARRINVNWDEFYFLSHVHALARGELDVLLQGAYAHLFTWATLLDADEIGQIDVLRLSMWPLLALSCFLLHRLARRWASAAGAWFAVLAFLACWPVLKHGMSFRADSLLLPLTLAAFILAGGSPSLRRDIGAGLCFGLAMAVSIKAALLLPALLAVFFLEAHGKSNGADASRFQLLRRLSVIAGTSALAIALVLAAHSGFVNSAAQRPEALVTHAVSSGLLEMPWFPRWNHFQPLLARDPALWLLLAAGTTAAIVRKRYGAAACALSLLPVLFYRNAFPYFYVLMLAPACAACAIAIDGIRDFAARKGRELAGTGAIAILFLLLAHGAWDHVMTLRFDEQGTQRSVVAAVHQVFPAPVPYIDHSGMIASFRKVNFFMSTWGVENYRRAGRDFMPSAVEQRPPLLLVNYPVLRPGTLLFRQLRAVDRELISASYVEYWGPIRVAGIDVRITAGGPIRARLPFPGRYRVESGSGVRVNGRQYAPRDIFDSGDSVDLVIEAAPGSDEETAVRLVWAAAQEPPRTQPPRRPLYLPL